MKVRREERGECRQGRGERKKLKVGRMEEWR
jgi:hypothetical protein